MALQIRTTIDEVRTDPYTKNIAFKMQQVLNHTHDHMDDVVRLLLLRDDPSASVLAGQIMVRFNRFVKRWNNDFLYVRENEDGTKELRGKLSVIMGDRNDEQSEKHRTLLDLIRVWEDGYHDWSAYIDAVVELQQEWGTDGDPKRGPANPELLSTIRALFVASLDKLEALLVGLYNEAVKRRREADEKFKAERAAEVNSMQATVDAVIEGTTPT